MTQESGRSLTEMLGVLAVMGIITLAGVRMFHSAMAQHRANEIINEANKRAVSIAAKIMTGQENLSISEFQNPEGYTFGVEKNPANSEQFNITVNGVDAEACRKMKAMVGHGTTLRAISEFCDKLTFNNNLSKIAHASDIQNAIECANSGNTWCSGSGVCSDVGCCEGKILSECQTCEQGAIVTTPKEGKTCTYIEEEMEKTGVCHLGVCQAFSENMICSEEGHCFCPNGSQPCNWATKECCTVGQICNSGGDVTEGTGTNVARCIVITNAEDCATDNSCSECTTNEDCKSKDATKPWCTYTVTNSVPTKGTCKALGDPIITTVYGLGEVMIGPNYTNWFNAKNWCEANGKNLINVEQFQIYLANEKLLKTGNGSTSVNACTKGKNCTPWDSRYPSNAMWEGNTVKTLAARTLTDARDENGELYSSKYSPVVLDLARQFRYKFDFSGFWTASDTMTTNCTYAYAVNLVVGVIDVANPVSRRGNTQYRPLCQ